MKYACLIYVDERAAAGRAAAEDVLRRLGRLAAQTGGAVLEPAAAAMSVRCRNGGVTVAAGPGENRAGQLAAVLLIDAANLDAALTGAARFTEPAVGVEVRPVRSTERRGPKRIVRGKVVPLRAYD